MAGDAGGNVLGPVLLDLAYEMGIRVECTCHGNEIGPAVRQHGLSKVRIVEFLRHADWNCVSNRPLQLFGDGHETTVSPFGALEDFASRLINSGGDVDQVDAGFHEELAEGDGVGGREATLHIFLPGHAVAEGMLRTP